MTPSGNLAIKLHLTLGADAASDIIVYTRQGLGANGIITYQRLASDGSPVGPSVQITDGATDDQLNDVSGNRIVYTAFDQVALRHQVKVYSIDTGEAVSLLAASAFADGSRAAILRIQPTRKSRCSRPRRQPPASPLPRRVGLGPM